MYEKAPENINVSFPVTGGVIADYNNMQTMVQELLEKNPNVVLVSEEVGYGIVPADAFERRYRETVGRICTELAAGSSKVTRVVCGIGMVLKNA